MQLVVENPGKALIHFTKARNQMQAQADNLANCKQCHTDLRKSYQEGAKFFQDLLEQVQAQV